MSKPLAGFSFCCTAIPLHEREVISLQLKTLGGIHYSDLMSDVNYLIVGERDTDKYKYCIKNRFDIVFLRPDAIQQVYDSWISGADSQSALDINNYQLTLFENHCICLSRIEQHPSQVYLLQPSHRKGQDPRKIYDSSIIASKIQENHGQFTESLTQQNTVVITTERSGRRYDKAVEWNIPVVHPLWVFDSLVRGATLDPNDYLLDFVSQAKPLDGCHVWMQLLRKAPVPTEQPKTKDPKEPKVLKKTNRVWNSIMTHASVSRPKFIKDSAWDENDDDEYDYDDDTDSHAFKKQKVDAKQQKEPALFQGLKFLVIGFTTHQFTLLQKVVKPSGGEIVDHRNLQDEESDTITHIILPFKNGSQSSTMLRMLDSKTKARINDRDILVVTEWFVERSIYYNRVVYDSWCKPLKGLIKSNRKFKICISGFTGIELLHLTKLIEILDFEFCDTLSPKRDLLVININLFKTTLMKNSPALYQYKYKDILDCPIYASSNNSNDVSLISLKNKINAAKKWNIPIVSIGYLWEMVTKSAGKEALIMPDIMNLQWCLFAPMNYSRPKTLLEYVRNLSGGSFETQRSDKSQSETPPNEEEQMKLPSPRKSHLKQQYGRIIGNSSDSLTSKLLQAQSEPEQPNENDITILEDEDAPTQVGYATDLLKSNEELLKRLSDSHRDVRKRKTRSHR